MHFFTWLKNLCKLTGTKEDHEKRLSRVEYLCDLHLSLIESIREKYLQCKKELNKLKEESKGIPIEVVEQPKESELEKPSFKTYTHYDPQLNVEYVEIEINGEKASPDDDTAVEHY